MDTEANGLTLEGLAKRLEALERENERMRSENAELRHNKVATLEGSGTRWGEVPALRGPDRRGDKEAETSEPDGLVSRKWLLSKAGAAAVGTAAAGALLLGNTRQAAASHYDDPIRVDYVVTHLVRAFGLSEDKHALYGEISSDADDGAVWGRNFSSGPGVKGTSDSVGVKGRASGLSGTGVEGIADGSNGTGVNGTGRYGVWGESNQAGFYGVTGRNTNTNGTGVRGVGAKQGVLGQSTSGIGVMGVGKHGLYGESSTAGVGAVEGHNSGGGHGVGAVGRVGLLAFSHEDGWVGAWGRHTGDGYGVAGDSGKGIGVSGFSNSGYGGQFDGGKAQLRLVPKGSPGPPTTGTHRKGEIYMDSRGALFVCTAGDGTTVGTWRRVDTTAV